MDMETVPEPVDRYITTPFLLKLYYRTGAFHRPDEFSSPTDFPPHITVHTWLTATLSELTHLLADASSTLSPPLLPSPAIGTRLAFRHLYHDLRSGDSTRLATQDLGSVVIGAGGPGAATSDENNHHNNHHNEGRLNDNITPSEHDDDDAAKTLADARFVVGDILSVAILPPSAVDGSVAPAGAARIGRGYGVGSGLGEVNGRGEPYPAVRGRAAGAGYVHGRGGGMGPDVRGVWGERDARGAPPLGEWRRGERLPDAPVARGRGRGMGRPSFRW